MSACNRCGDVATLHYFDADVCDACATPAERVCAAREQAMREAGASLPSDALRADVTRLRHAAWERGWAEMEGERIDWTRPVDGWVLW